MNIRISKLSLLSLSIAALSVLAPVQAGDKAGDKAATKAEANTGSASVVLKYVKAVLPTGAPTPGQDAACTKQLSAVTSRYVGLTVKTKYSIDTQTLIMSAKSSFASPVSTQPLQLTVPMHPLGLSSNYSFGAFRPVQLKNAYVLFSISKQFTNPQSTFLILNESLPYNCVISSNPEPLSSAESTRFDTDVASQ